MRSANSGLISMVDPIGFPSAVSCCWYSPVVNVLARRPASPNDKSRLSSSLISAPKRLARLLIPYVNIPATPKTIAVRPAPALPQNPTWASLS